ncbi:MAG: valine--tRNA ligase [Eubacteriales bacterium]|nr:valine--tRNA ligase [Eubacteriales bacterium]
MKELEKKYDPSIMEDRIYEKWMKMGYFHANEKSLKKAFSISMPPPNVTGQLHMGHALDNTLQDTLCRYKRMKGFEVLWQPGTDHAAIATEVKVIKKIESEGKNKYELGREGFLKEAWAWKEEYESRIIGQLHKLGVSADWDRTRFTMDEGCSKAVEKVFISLYNKGLIYKGRRIVNWCPVCKTSISDAEVIHEDQASFFWHIKYPIAGEEGRFLEVATTRPETMFGDTAVAVNPKDERYKDLIGKCCILPLVDKEIPIVGDEHADMEFGTGCVKITPAHDPNDFEVGLRHNLEQICILHDDATMDMPGTKYDGMDRYVCRKEVEKDLEEQGYLVKKVPHSHNVGTHDRCGSTVEPMVKPQWFVKMDTLAEHCKKVLETGELKFVPENYSKTYMNWVDNMKDWCISRQLWWGHRIPAWYCDSCGKIHVGSAAPEKCDCGSAAFTQDPDTLDTWFSSALWPFSTLGWPEETDTLKKFYPNDVLVTGYDIIFFWVIRMVFSGVEQMGECPFDKVLIHGLVRDALGRKMSKSLGNGIDPLVVVEQYGADALRAALLTGNAPGNDMRFTDEKVINARNFANKVWNAARFIMMNVENAGDEVAALALSKSAYGVIPEGIELQKEDKWILSKLNAAVDNVTRNMDGFELGVALDNVMSFLWDELCDWYIEMVKARLRSEDKATRAAALWTLNTALINGLKMLHPFMPFITEEIFVNLTGEESIMISEYPEYAADWSFNEDASDVEGLKEAVRAIRGIRADKNVPPSKKVSVYVVAEDEKVRKAFEAAKNVFASLVQASDVSIRADKAGIDANAVSAVTSNAAIFIPLNELVDMAEELARLKKEEKRLEGELERSGKMLSNEKFISKAPAAKIEEEKTKQATYEEMMRKVREQIAALS